MSFRLTLRHSIVAAALAVTLGLAITIARACPFCSAVGLTFSEEIAGSPVAVVAKLVQVPPRSADDAASFDAPAKSKFEIVDIIKGKEVLGHSKVIEAIFLGDQPVGTSFLVMGIDPPNISWSTPIALSPRGLQYLLQAVKLPKEGPERLAFFLNYVEDPDLIIRTDAYDEFAKTPFDGLKSLQGVLNHDQLVTWIKNTDIPASHRRLYVTMLSICGTPADIPMLEEMIRSKDTKVKAGLDAIIGCYLSLKGPDGMPLIEDLFLNNKKAEYTDTYAAIMALRFHGQDTHVIPKDRILNGMHFMLGRPELADLVIPDLARWQDWSVMEQLVALFKNATEESQWVRVPVVNYLRACPDPKAKEYLAELAKIDPESVKRASMFLPMGGGAQPSASAASSVPNKAPAKP